MKKLLTMVVVALMTTMNVSAQTAGEVNYRFQIGPNMSTLTNSDDAKYKIGYSVGAGFDFCLTDKFAIGLDITRDNIGAKSKYYDENVNLEYIGFGPLARYYATPWLCLYAGPEINFLTSAKIDDASCKSICKKNEFSVPVGISFEPVISKNRNIALTVDLRYRIGLSKVNKESFIGANDVKNSAFILTIGYKAPF